MGMSTSETLYFWKRKKKIENDYELEVGLKTNKTIKKEQAIELVEDQIEHIKKRRNELNEMIAIELNEDKQNIEKMNLSSLYLKDEGIEVSFQHDELVEGMFMTLDFDEEGELLEIDTCDVTEFLYDTTVTFKQKSN